MVGLFTIWRGQSTDREKPNDVVAGFSRDGFHSDRPSRKPLLAVSEKYGDWNYSNVQSAGGVCLVGDRLFFYYSGRGGVPGIRAPGQTYTGLATTRSRSAVCVDGRRRYRRVPSRRARLCLRVSTFSVRTDSHQGELRVEVLDQAGRPIEPFTRSNSVRVQTDNTLQRVAWKGAADLSSLAGKTVRFRFHLRAGSLYSFWVSPEESGASYGYAAAGGPRLRGIAGRGRIGRVSKLLHGAGLVARLR